MTACPIQSIKPETDQVWIDGKLYTIDRLPSQSFIEEMEKKGIDKKDLNLAKKLQKKTEGEQKEAVRKKIESEKRAKVIARRPKNERRKRITPEEWDEITATEQEIEAEWRRLMTVASQL